MFYNDTNQKSCDSLCLGSSISLPFGWYVVYVSTNERLDLGSSILIFMAFIATSFAYSLCNIVFVKNDVSAGMCHVIGSSNGTLFGIVCVLLLSQLFERFDFLLEMHIFYLMSIFSFLFGSCFVIINSRISDTVVRHSHSKSKG
jgi:hypothetical protein